MKHDAAAVRGSWNMQEPPSQTQLSGAAEVKFTAPAPMSPIQLQKDKFYN